jgi:hypothetical protein
MNFQCVNAYVSEILLVELTCECVITNGCVTFFRHHRLETQMLDFQWVTPQLQLEILG